CPYGYFSFLTLETVYFLCLIRLLFPFLAFNPYTLFVPYGYFSLFWHLIRTDVLFSTAAFYPFKDVTVQMSSFVRLHLPILQSSFARQIRQVDTPPYPGLSSIKISLRPIFIPPYSALQGSALSLPAGLYIQKFLSDFPHPDWHSTHRKGTASRTDLSSGRALPPHSPADVVL